jgi:mycofactocin precursor
MDDPVTEADDQADERELGATELLVEEVSIDGLCGVY